MKNYNINILFHVLEEADKGIDTFHPSVLPS